jgi:hypothetical protein
MNDMSRTKWQWGKIFSMLHTLSLPVIIPQIPHTNLSLAAGTTGLLVVTTPKDSLSIITLLKLKLVSHLQPQ